MDYLHCVLITQRCHSITWAPWRLKSSASRLFCNLSRLTERDSSNVLHRWPADAPHNGPVIRKVSPCSRYKWDINPVCISISFCMWRDESTLHPSLPYSPTPYACMFDLFKYALKNLIQGIWRIWCAFISQHFDTNEKIITSDGFANSSVGGFRSLCIITCMLKSWPRRTSGYHIGSWPKSSHFANTIVYWISLNDDSYILLWILQRFALRDVTDISSVLVLTMAPNSRQALRWTGVDQELGHHITP